MLEDTTVEEKTDRVTRLWSELTGNRVDEQVLEVLARADPAGVLVHADAAVLDAAARSAFVAERTYLPFGLWVAATRSLQGQLSAAMNRVPGPLQQGETAEDRIDAANRWPQVDLIERILALSHTATWARDLDAPTLSTAFELLQQRAGHAAWAAISLEGRRPTWERKPLGLDFPLPVVETNRVERCIVTLLSRTHPELQFSVSVRQVIFAGVRNGNHEEWERRYVTGLSDILDSVTREVLDHRGPGGGRFFVKDNKVECAECRHLIAWIGQAGDDRMTMKCTERAPTRGSR